MFNNLIESSSHKREFKRRGSFFLFTTAAYAVLFVIAGVASIYAYDDQLSDPSNEITLVEFVPPKADTPVAHTSGPRRAAPPRGSSVGERSTRPVLTTNTNNPLVVPNDVSATPLSLPPANPNSVVGPQVLDPPGMGSSDRQDDGASTGGDTAIIVKTDEDPPPLPTPSPKRIIHITQVLNGKALSLPKPEYPSLAKRVGVEGTVSVQVLIDETGKVISAKSVAGNPLLSAAAQKAALEARFSPTVLNEQAVKVSGVITYNFQLR
jgi:protein TonB